MGGMSGGRYNPDCDTCTYAWCCGRCYCCHPGPVFEIRKVDAEAKPVDETSVELACGLWVPAWAAELMEAGDLGQVVEECEGCDWPGRCKAYGSEGCRMKADERLRVEADRG